MKILIVEDEKKLADSVKRGLSEASFTADAVYTGNDGFDLALSGNYDVIILDMQLPEMNGIEILKRLRAEKVQTPVLFLTAKGGLEDKISAFDSGCDDYLVKPFAFSELLARINAISRRRAEVVPPVLSVGDLELNLATRRVTRGKRDIDLRPKEFSILQYLIENKGRVITRTNLLEHVWDYAFATGSNVIDVHMKRLREKIDRSGDKKLIQTVKGVGYRIG